ncbi:MAG TPA: LacI family DNA-binding transcriptional regulator [Gaiellaceae bacterium]|jgi:DNA-binding LacI/PurR family transcriptional regulator
MAETAQPTLADVAAEAGVSLSTASRALRDTSAGTDAARRVRTAARRLGYEPNRLARSLRTRSSHFVGVVVPDIAIGFYGRAVKGAQDALERAGYQVLVMNTERNAPREAAALRTLVAHRVDGILVATSGGYDAVNAIPVVFFDNLAEGAGVAQVARANREGMAIAVDHLVEHGHERIGFLGVPPRLTSAAERLDGFRAAMARHGLEAPDGYVGLGDEDWSAESGRRAMLGLLSLDRPPTAIVAASDHLALGAMQAARQARRRVPRDLAVISYDDPFFGELFDPPLTALARNEHEVGRLAASLLLHAIESGSTSPPAQVRVAEQLIVRRSCGC